MVRRLLSHLGEKLGPEGADPFPPYVPTSVVLDNLFRTAPTEHVTLDWMMQGLGHRSFGVVLLVLALCGALPGVSVVAGLLLFVPAVQMLRAHARPAFPPLVGARPIAAPRLMRLIGRVVPVLRQLERVVHPRWPMPYEPTKRLVGGAVLLLGCGLFVPVPLSNVPPATIIALIAFAYLEEDGALLCVALVAGLAVLAVVAGLAWQTLSMTGWVTGIL